MTTPPTATCIDCSAPIPWQGKRGVPPKRCNQCKRAKISETNRRNYHKRKWQIIAELQPESRAIIYFFACPDCSCVVTSQRSARPILCNECRKNRIKNSVLKATKKWMAKDPEKHKARHDQTQKKWRAKLTAEQKQGMNRRYYLNQKKKIVTQAQQQITEAE